MLQVDPGPPNGVHIADGRTIQLGNPSACPPEKDVGEGTLLVLVRPIIDVQDDLSGGARLHLVVVPDREHRLQVGEIDAIGVPSCTCHERAPKHSP